jgi:hypothetical protein
LWFGRRSVKNQLRDRVRELEDEVTELQKEIISLRKTQGSLDRIIHQMLEPAQDGECRKVRLHTVAEGQAYRLKVANDLHRLPEEFSVYRCRICPRHPATGDRYIHIANVTRRTRLEKQGDYQKVRRDNRKEGLVPMVTPADIARLREKFKGE